MRKPVTQQRYQAWWIDVLCVIAGLVLAYSMSSLAIDSGSLIQYFITFVLLLFSVNRFTHILLVIFRKGTAK